MAGFISEADAAALVAAANVLRKLQRTALDEALPSRGLEVSDVLSHGRFMEACKRADDSLFDALNVASAYLRDGTATATIGRWER